MRQRSDVCVSLQYFMNFTRNQFGKTAKIVRTDNGTEFINSLYEQLFKQLGVIHQTTCVYTPQQNGVAERKHRHILEITRAIRLPANIPKKILGALCLSYNILDKQAT